MLCKLPRKKILPGVKPTNYRHYHHVKIHSRVHSGTYILGVTKSLLIGLKVQERIHAWFCIPSQLPMAGEVMNPRRELMTAIFSNHCNSQLLSKYLYPLVSGALICHQRSFFLQQTELQQSTNDQTSETNELWGHNSVDISITQNPYT